MFITEEKHHYQTVFNICKRDSSGNVIVERTLQVVFAITKIGDGKKVYLIYDEQMCPIPEIFNYLNFKRSPHAENTILRSITPLRLLVAFCTAIGVTDFRIPETLCEDFIRFLHRGGKVGTDTAAQYFSDIRLFLEYLKRDSTTDPILSYTEHTRFSTGADGVSRPEHFRKYDFSPSRYYGRDRYSPPHNSKEDFNKILEVASNKKDFAGILILMLEFLMGRRCGEVLGLTIEDLSTHYDPDTQEKTHCLYIRNRLTDRTGQFAKRHNHPKAQKDYKSKDYVREYESPRGCIMLEKDIYDLLKNYIQSRHKEARKNYPQNYAKGIADIVNPDQFKEDWGRETNNYYIFLNNKGAPLTKAAWNKRLRQYYELANIPYGNGRSINHAWRHTVAYIMAHNLKRSKEEIADFLGHRSTATVAVYTKADYSTIGKVGHEVYEYLTSAQEDPKCKL